MTKHARFLIRPRKTEGGMGEGMNYKSLTSMKSRKSKHCKQTKAECSVNCDVQIYTSSKNDPSFAAL